MSGDGVDDHVEAGFECCGDVLRLGAGLVSAIQFGKGRDKFWPVRLKTASPPDVLQRVVVYQHEDLVDVGDPVVGGADG